MSERVMVAGVGNIFLGDDGFGSEVARALLMAPIPEGVVVRDVGIAGIHLAYELLDGFETLLLIDAVRLGRPPGTLTVIEPETEAGRLPLADAHGMDPRVVLEHLHALGGAPMRVLLVGCEPLSMEEGIGLSIPVREAVPRAVGLVGDLVRDLLGDEKPADERRDQAQSIPAGGVRPA